MLWGETRDHGVPIHERIQKFKTRIFIIISIFPPPIISDWRKLGWMGRLTLCFLADCCKWYAKMASSRLLLSLIDLSLDIYITFQVSGSHLKKLHRWKRRRFMRLKIRPLISKDILHPPPWHHVRHMESSLRDWAFQENLPAIVCSCWQLGFAPTILVPHFGKFWRKFMTMFCENNLQKA